MHRTADRLSRSEPYRTLTLDEDEREPVVIEPIAAYKPAMFVSLDVLEPVEVTLTPAAIPLGGSAIPADTAPTVQYHGGSFSDYDEIRELKVQRQTPGARLTRVVGLRQPRARGRSSHARSPGHRRTRRSTRAGPSSDSDSDGPGDDAGHQRRRVVVDSHYCIVEIVVSA